MTGQEVGPGGAHQGYLGLVRSSELANFTELQKRPLESIFDLRFLAYNNMITRPGVARAVLQTPMSCIHSLSQSVSHPFPANLQNIITQKPLELGTC